MRWYVRSKITDFGRFCQHQIALFLYAEGLEEVGLARFCAPNGSNWPDFRPNFWRFDFGDEIKKFRRPSVFCEFFEVFYTPRITVTARRSLLYLAWIGLA